ncbi:MAG: hypothetical protein J5I28_01215 [Acidimicrobiales bacterium]|nr:hypothetical protein [Acidimicrobiales bacterium]HLV90665.1 RcpC/CpaB family pilus assembly protein [Acidimicrobiia bacterium]
MSQRPSLVTREAGTSPPTIRRTRRRISASHVLIALAVVLAFVLNILALRDRGASTLVAVADRPIAAGSILVPDVIRLVSADADFPGLATLITEDDLDASFGSVVTRALPAGSVVDRASLAAPDSGSGMRVMSLEVEESRAAGGTLAAGDRIDVIAVRDGVATYVVSDAEVVAVPEKASGALGSTGYHVVVAVDADEALALAEAMAAGKIDVVRSTGAPPVGRDTDGTGR